MKTCTRCGETKALSGFYRHPRGAQGRDSVCKPCKRKAVNENRELKADFYRERQRMYDNTPKRVAARITYRASPRGQAAVRAAHRRYNRWRRVIAPPQETRT